MFACFRSKWVLSVLLATNALVANATCTVANTVAADVFVAKPPYLTSVNGSSIPVELLNIPRVFDFGGDAPFLSTNGAAHLETINFWNTQVTPAVEAVKTSSAFPVDGIPGRVFKTNGYTAVGYVANDGPAAGKLRTQINTFQIPSRQKYVWDLKFKLGGATYGSAWPIRPRNESPAVLWQLKTTGLPPSLTMAVHTDPSNPNKVMLEFWRRYGSNNVAEKIGEIGNLNPSTDTSVVIEAFLDERLEIDGGEGYIAVSVNGQNLFAREEPTLQPHAYTSYHWSVAMYLWNNESPLSYSKFGYWKRARMLVPVE